MRDRTLKKDGLTVGDVERTGRSVQTFVILPRDVRSNLRRNLPDSSGTRRVHVKRGSKKGCVTNITQPWGRSIIIKSCVSMVLSERYFIDRFDLCG